jgi:purine-cytosine permease-like protein
MTATVADPAWEAAYKSGSIGGLLGQALSPVGGFGKFCLVLLALSIVANNIPNNYSVPYLTLHRVLTSSWVYQLKSSVTGQPKSPVLYGL